jgi:hypothetical protein
VKGRKDGNPIPNLESFMMGYKKTVKNGYTIQKENRYLTVNLQTWTNKQKYLSMVCWGKGNLEPICVLCKIFAPNI